MSIQRWRADVGVPAAIAAWVALVLAFAGSASALPRRLPFIVYAGMDKDQKWALYTMGIDGGDPVQMTGDGRRDDAHVVHGVSRDGSRLLASVDRGDGFHPEALDWSANSVAEYPYGDLPHASGPSWSPREDMLVFAAYDGRVPGPSGDNVYVLDVDTRRVEQLTDFGARDPVWSPDGTRIAFTSGRDHAYDVFVMDDDGGNIRNLTDDENLQHYPSWSPDATTIVFAQGPGVWKQELYAMPADGGARRRIVDPGDRYGYIWSSSRSSDGEFILFSATDIGQMGSDIFRVRPDGSDLRRLTSNAGNRRAARHPFLVGYPLSVSALGKRALVWGRLKSGAN